MITFEFLKKDVVIEDGVVFCRDSDIMSFLQKDYDLFSSNWEPSAGFIELVYCDRLEDTFNVKKIKRPEIENNIIY